MYVKPLDNISILIYNIIKENKTTLNHERTVNIMAKYDAYGIKSITKLYKIGKECAEQNLNAYEVIEKLEELGYNVLEAIKIVNAGMKYGDRLTLEEKTWYRIGEPIVELYGDYYKPSYNYADDRPEEGISVITKKWMNSLKSVFFGAHDDEKIAAKGVYKIKGVQIGFGGDDEPLIYATDWAEKTSIKTFDEIMEVLQ